MTSLDALPTGPRIPHVRALDGLRGLAVVAVLLFHAGHLDGGYLGVDLFFVLSGFLITSLLLAEWRGTRRVRLSAFWARRARRLLPALFLMLVGVGLYAAFIAAPSELDRIRGDALATLGYVANWHSIGAGHDYWALFSAPSPLEHTWSLAIEEQFYLVWPLLFVGLGIFTGRRQPLAPRVFWVALTGAALLGGLALTLAFVGGNDTRIYFGTDTRAPAILLGVALAALFAWRGTVRSRGGRVALEVAGVAGVAWLAWAYTSLGGQDPDLVRGGLLISSAAAVAVLAAAWHPTRGPIGTALSFAPLCWLGLVSYGLYLWHWPVYVWLDAARTGLDGWGLTFARIAVSLAFAAASYFAVELPIRHGALRGRPIAILTPAAIALTLAVVLVTTTGGVSRPTTAETIATGRRKLVSAPPPTPTVPRILVVGDSVAWSLGKQIDGVKATLGVESYNLGVIGCQIPRSDQHRPPFGTADHPTDIIPTRADCRDWPNRWHDDLALAQPSDVLLALGFPAVEDDELNGVWHAACSPWWRRFVQSEMVKAVNLLGSTGAKVWVASVLPPDDPTVFSRKLPQDVACLNKILRKTVAVSSARASILDLVGYLCPRKGHSCRTALAGQPLRTDLVHYDGPGGRFVAMWLVQNMTKPSPPAPGRK